MEAFIFLLGGKVASKRALEFSLGGWYGPLGLKRIPSFQFLRKSSSAFACFIFGFFGLQGLLGRSCDARLRPREDSWEAVRRFLILVCLSEAVLNFLRRFGCHTGSQEGVFWGWPDFCVGA